MLNNKNAALPNASLINRNSAKMKKTLVGGLCASFIVSLSACNAITALSSEQAATKATTAIQPALSSGIDFQYFDKSVRPQDDFYAYINGTWIKNTKIAADRTRAGTFYDLRDQSQQDIKDIIKSLADTPNLKAGTDEQKVAALYGSYMDIDTLNKLGLEPIKADLSTVANLNSKAQLSQYFGQNQTIGGASPVQLYVDVDYKNSSQYILSAYQSGLTLPEKDYYLNKSQRFVRIRQAYLAHIEKMYTLAGLPQAKASAATILKLETAIARKQWSAVENRDNVKQYNPYTVKGLMTLAPNINWTQLLTAFNIGEQNKIIINQPSFVKGVSDLIGSESLATWKTYLQWQVLHNAASLLSQPFEDENFDFFTRTLNGQEKQQPRWKSGVSVVNHILGEVVGKVYVKHHFSQQAKQRMVQLVANLRQAYGDSVADLDWMSAKTKLAAKDKLSKFTPKIGYPDKWEDYSKLAIKADDLFGNVQRASKLNHQKEIAKLGDPIHKWEWGMTPQTINAYYNPMANEVVFPAAILQPPFFNMKADDAVNYGAIGAVIGHEMGHGFDDQGAKFDGDGNMRNWWTAEDKKNFDTKTKALIEQYNNYYVYDDLHVNGALTLGENIGDLSGITIAYKAYHNSLKGKAAPVIDGLTGDQRFFIGFTQIWRSKAKEAAMRNQVATDPHPPSNFRTIGALGNMPEFYKTFNVKPGDKMYIAPEKRVKIW